MKVERVQANLDFQTVYQALGLVLENIDAAKRLEYEASLTLDNKGLFVFDTTDSKPYVWDGTQFVEIGGSGGGISDNIDAGTASSIYTIEQNINAGNA